jgi:hypothetical protein
MKRVGVRGAVDYLERFAKGWLDITFTTQAGGEPRAATEEDIGFAYHLADVLGPADGRTAVHADTIKIDPKSFESGGGRSSKITWSEWISICNSEISKLILGGTLTTEVGGASGGNRALGEVQERAEVDLEQFDATALAETLKRDLVTWLVRLNMPEALHVVPSITIDIETEPDAKSIVDNAAKLVDMGAPLEAEDVASKAGYKCVPSEEKDSKGRPKPRRLFKSDFINPSLVDPSLMSAEAKQAAQDKIDLETQTALTKASAPAAPPGRPSASASAKKAAKTPKPAAKTAKPKPKTAPKPKPANDAVEAEEDDDDEEDAAE